MQFGKKASYRIWDSPAVCKFLRVYWKMNREYHKWYSPSLKSQMELLVFGHSGPVVLFFPTRCARFYDYEDWGVLEGVRGKLESGNVQIYCLDSVDHESFYCWNCTPQEKIKRYLEFEKYVLEEVIPLTRFKNPDAPLISAGCSMGAYHAANIAFKHPHLFNKVLAMSGRYDLTKNIRVFKDLFGGYRDENIYYNMPSYFIPHLSDENILGRLREMEIILVVGQEDAFLLNNIELSRILTKKGIENHLYIWEDEAHKPKDWVKMLSLYL